MRVLSWITISVGVLAAAPVSVPAQTVAPQAPFRAGRHYFFIAADGGLYVRDALHGAARKLLQAGAFETLAPSWDGKSVAYGMPSYGRASYDVLVLNVSSGGVYPEVLHNARITRAPWTANNKGFLYTKEDTGEHRERVYYHRVGEPQQRDEIVYSRQDALDWRYDTRISDDGQFAILTISHPQDAHTRLYFIDLDDPGKPSLNAPVVKLMDEFGARYEFIDNGGNSFFLQTNERAARGKIVLANTDVTRASRWPTIWPEATGTDTLQFVRTAGESYVVAVYRNGTQSAARVLTLPDPNKMRRFIDSTRRANGIRPRLGPPVIGMPVDSQSSLSVALTWRLELKRLIPLLTDNTIVDMRSRADQDEVYYTVKRPDGTLTSYVYNVTNGKNTPFDTGVAAR